MARHAILHIGPMKTGSTSIQLWLDQRAAALAERGFHVPISLQGRNHSRLAVVAHDKALGRNPAPQDVDRLSALAAEIDGLDPAFHTVVFSGEMLGQSLKDLGDVQALKAMLEPMFDSYTIVVYLRRQDELSLSRYSTALRRGEKRARPLANPIDYDLLLEMWSTVFGRENIRPRMFLRDTLKGGDVVQDFADAVSLPFSPSQDATPERNPSLLPAAQAFLADLANSVREAGYARHFTDIARHDDINKLLNAQFAGKGMRPARADAIAFYDQVRDSNERVRARWFPDRNTLFPEDFSAYPETGDAEPRPRDRLEVAMSVLTALVTSTGSGGGAATVEDRAALQDIRRERRRLKKQASPDGKPRGKRAGGRRAERRGET